MKITNDFETRSEFDLRRGGAFEYSMHDSTEPLCWSFKVGNGQTRIIKFGEFDLECWGSSIAAHTLAKLIKDGNYILSAHNAYFEQCIYNNILVPKFGWPEVPIKTWRCTAAKAASHALPRALGNACEAYGLPIQKDTGIGYDTMMKMCKPTKAWVKWAKSRKGPEPVKWHEDPADFEILYQYCIIDTEAEFLLDEALPDLIPWEQDLWFLDQKMNMRGVRVDVDTVQKVLKMLEVETKALKTRTEDLTFGLLESPTKRAQFLNFLKLEGVEADNTQARTMQALLDAGNLTPTAKELIEIKQALSKTSTAKFKAFLIRALRSGRARDLLLYWAASTGRWGGRGIQVQNFPRGTIDDIDEAIEIVRSGSLDWIKAYYGEPFSVFSSILRGMITASEGKELFVADYASIEMVVLFWMSGNLEGLKAFTNKEDLYKLMAMKIYRIKDVTKVTKFQRQVGKAAVLGCGYGMGWKKFLATAKIMGIEIDEETAKLAVAAYREEHYHVPQLWRNLEKAAMLAVLNPTKKVVVNRTKWFVKGRFLYCELPSGRCLAYCDPSVKEIETPWGEKRPCLHYWGVDGYTKKWAEETNWGGGLVENVVQAVSRDLTADALKKGDAKGFDMLMTVHDELIGEADIGLFGTKDFEDILLDAPAWAKGLPLRAECFKSERYRK